MRVLPWCGLLLTSCLQIGLGDADGGTGGAAGGTQTADAAASAAITGTQCGTDSASGLTLCAGISRCPGVAIDRDVYPDCGFRVPNQSIDVECLCGDFVCPLGTALNCSDVQALLASQSGPTVCLQTSEGRCAPRGTSKGTGGGSGCDRTCLESCNGNPGCVTLCGC